MVDPGIALLAAGAFAALIGFLFWPKKGLVPLVVRALRKGERETIEDALKHLYDCEYLGSLGSIQSLAGSLEVSTSRVTELVDSPGVTRACANRGGGSAAHGSRAELRPARDPHSSALGDLSGRTDRIRRGGLALRGRPT